MSSLTGRKCGRQFGMMDKEEEKRREWLKHASPKEKREYYRYYYTVPVLIVIAVAAVVISYARTALTQKDPALYVTLVNFAALKDDSGAMADSFAAEHINTKKEEIAIDNSSYISANETEENFIKYGYEDEQRLMTFVYTGLIDIMISGDDIIERYAQQQWFDDLRTILDADTYAELEEEGRILTYEGIPVAVNIDDSELLTENYYYSGEGASGIYAAFPANSEHRELGVSFLLYLINKG